MNLLFIILPLALLIAGGFVCAFVWAARKGQFDDLDTPSMRVLGEDDVALEKKEEEGRLT